MEQRGPPVFYDSERLWLPQDLSGKGKFVWEKGGGDLLFSILPQTNPLRRYEFAAASRWHPARKKTLRVWPQDADVI